LRDLYHETDCVVKGEGCCSLLGLRQGCPLSTTLFNLYIWDVHQRLLAVCPGVGVPIGPKLRDPSAPAPPLVTDLGYADDVSLCSSTAEGLQSLIDGFVPTALGAT
jgi:hypothetical protein